MNKRNVFTAIAVCAGLLAAERAVFCEELIPRGSSAWKFTTIAPTESVPDGFLTSRAYDESGMEDGTAPFGADSGCTCPMAIGTAWAPGTRLLARHHFQNSLSGPVVFTLTIAFSGTLRLVVIAGGMGPFEITHQGCAGQSDTVGELPWHVFPAGHSVIAIVAEGDRSAECMTSRFDLGLTGAGGWTPTVRRSWGTLKSRYR